MIDEEYVCIDCGKKFYGTIAAAYHVTNGHRVELTKDIKKRNK